MKLDYGCGEKEAVFSVYTMMLYEQEFGSDIVQDVFGLSVIRRKPEGEDILFSIDYRSINWVKCVKALWAALKAADDTVPSFAEWSKQTEEIDLNKVADAVLPAATKGFFRAGASDTD